MTMRTTSFTTRKGTAMRLSRLQHKTGYDVVTLTRLGEGRMRGKRLLMAKEQQLLALRTENAKQLFFALGTLLNWPTKQS